MDMLVDMVEASSKPCENFLPCVLGIYANKTTVYIVKTIIKVNIYSFLDTLRRYRQF